MAFTAGRPLGGSSDARRRLLDGCWQLLLAGSPPTVAAVCDVARCAAPTLYHHFGDLRGLLETAAGEHFLEWAGEVEAEVGHLDDPVERLRRRGAAYVAWGVAHPAAYRVLFIDLVEGRGGDRLEAVSGFDALLADVRAVRQPGSAGDDADAVLTAGLALWSAVHGLTCLAISNPGFQDATREATYALLATALVNEIAGAKPTAGR